MSWSERLPQIGITLPPAAKPVANYVPAVRIGDLVYTSGQLPFVSGKLEFRGKVHEGADGTVTPEQAVSAARQCTLNALSAIDALVGTSFLESSAMAKVINTGTNLGALAVFAAQGHVMWLLGLALAVGNIAGAQLGSHMALGRGSSFVRWVLLVVVVVMVAKLGFDMVGTPDRSRG